MGIIIKNTLLGAKMNKKGLKTALGISKEQFESLKTEFEKSEKIDIIKSVIYGTLLGKTIGQVVGEISLNNAYLMYRNYKKLNGILTEEKFLMAVAFKEILKEKLKKTAIDGGAL